MTNPQMTEKLSWQGALRLVQNRLFKIRTTNGHGTGFHIGNFGSGTKLCGIATALHVVHQAFDWAQPIKIIHAQTGRERLLNATDRAIFTYPNKDLAIIVFTLNDTFSLTDELINLIPTDKSLAAGVDVGWCGFPAIKNDRLCFFHGYISCYLDQEGDYLIDGVAIHGVSGSPVFYVDDSTNMPFIAGVITQYIANRSTGETLPGVSMITSIAPCEDTIKSLKNLAQAQKEAEQQKQNLSDNPPPIEAKK